jgi:hypothetical protein
VRICFLFGSTARELPPINEVDEEFDLFVAMDQLSRAGCVIVASVAQAAQEPRTDGVSVSHIISSSPTDMVTSRVILERFLTTQVSKMLPIKYEFLACLKSLALCFQKNPRKQTLIRWTEIWGGFIPMITVGDTDNDGYRDPHVQDIPNVRAPNTGIDV